MPSITLCRFIFAIIIALHLIGNAWKFTRTTNRKSSLSLHATTATNDHSKVASPDNNINNWRAGYVDCPEERCEILKGEVPKDLIGTLFRNGYGKFHVGKETIQHPFDADGMITAITFNNQQALFRNRFVRTKGFLRERRAKRILYRGAFGTQKKGGMIANMFDTFMKNVANTNVVYCGENRLLALWEGGNPHRLEADSLRTIGKHMFRGLLKDNQPFSAHGKFDSHTGRYISFSAATSPTVTPITIYEFDSQWQLYQQRTFDVKGFSLFHDFIVTKNYYIFTKNPLSFKPIPFLLGQKGPAECIDFDKNGSSYFYIVPRDPNKAMQVIEADAHFNFHYGNAYEDEQGNIHFDVVRCDNMVLGADSKANEPIWQSIDFVKDVPLTNLVKYTLSIDNTNTSGIFTGVKKEVVYSEYIDFPIVHPDYIGKKNRFIYGSTAYDGTKSGPAQGFVKIDLLNNQASKWIAQPDEFISEVAFAKRQREDEDKDKQQQLQDEDDGYLLALTSKTSTLTSELLIFSAKDITTGPIVRMDLPTYIPYGLHGMFAEKALFGFEDVMRKFKVFSALDKKEWNEVDSSFSGIGLKDFFY